MESTMKEVTLAKSAKLCTVGELVELCKNNDLDVNKTIVATIDEDNIFVFKSAILNQDMAELYEKRKLATSASRA